MAWAREMGASEVIQELTKHGAIADAEWHGEKLEMKTNEERAEEAWGTENYDEDVEGNYDPESPAQSEPSRFEIEVENPKSKQNGASNNKDAPVLDALQRQRTTAKSVF